MIQLTHADDAANDGPSFIVVDELLFGEVFVYIQLFAGNPSTTICFMAGFDVFLLPLSSELPPQLFL